MAVELGMVVRSARLEAGLSVRDAAAAAGLATSHYQRLEAGEVREPSPVTLRRVARALGARYEVLLDAAGYL